MSELPQAGTVPEWTLGDRLRKAREHVNLKQSELAAEIGVSRASVVSYELGRYGLDRCEPPWPVLLAWSFRTGVSLRWLRFGYVTPDQPGVNDEIVIYPRLLTLVSAA